VRGKDGKPHLSDGDLVAYIDGDLADERHQRLAAHLARCAACRQRLEEFRGVGELIRQRYPPVDDPEARAKIVALTSGQGRGAAQAADPGSRIGRLGRRVRRWLVRRAR
jgi:anti-sigma factor RsiW